MSIGMSVQSRRKVELYSQLVESIGNRLVDSGYEKNTAYFMAEEIVFDIWDDWRGLQILFPMNPRRYMEKLKAKICKEFNGTNTTEIVRKYKISENILYRWNREFIDKNRVYA